jgi:hypothetical protein
VAQDRALPAGEDGRHPPSALREHTVAHCVHPRVKRVKPALADPPVDRPPPEPEMKQLSACYDPVLPSCESRDDRVDFTRLRFATYTVADDSLVSHTPDPAARLAPWGAGIVPS